MIFTVLDWFLGHYWYIVTMMFIFHCVSETRDYVRKVRLAEEYSNEPESAIEYAREELAHGVAKGFFVSLGALITIPFLFLAGAWLLVVECLTKIGDYLAQKKGGNDG